MSEVTGWRGRGEELRLAADVNASRGLRGIVACVDASKVVSKIIAHAIAIARAMRAELSLLRVLDATGAEGMAPDPVEWDMNLRASSRHLMAVPHP